MPEVVSGIMAGAAVYSAYKGAEAAEEAGDLDSARFALEAQRDAFNKEQVEETNEFAREDRTDVISRRDRERGLYDPIQEQIVSEAQKGPDYAGAAARSDSDVAQTFGIGREQNKRRQRQYGVNPYGGRSAEAGRRSGNEEALAKVGGRVRSRIREDDKSWSRRIAALGTGNMKDVTPTTNLAQLGVSGAAGVMKDMSGSESANAAGAYSLAGKLGADALSYASKGLDTPSPATTNTDHFSGSMAGDVNYFDF